MELLYLEVIKRQRNLPQGKKTVTWINAKNLLAKVKNAFRIPALATAVA